ncbi:MAG: hypothetical protein PF694_06660 [Bacteroidetes bacterium]|jgi:hypothetical protein|nr:hypothetical protein [Bacteroidota bacterium]
MAGSRDAFMGRLSGRIGNLVVYQMVGKTVVRVRPAYQGKKDTGKLKPVRMILRRLLLYFQSAETLCIWVLLHKR